MNGLEKVEDEESIAILGAGGLAREIACICEEIGCKDIILLDKGEKDSDVRFQVLDEGRAEELNDDGFKFVVAVGDNQLRKKIFKKHKDKVSFTNIIHPDSNYQGVDSHKKIGIGNIITQNTVITDNVQIGNFCIFNLGCTVGHDCIVEDFVTISPGANISGNVHLEKGAYIGTGSSIVQGEPDNKITVGSWSTVGLSSAVTRDVEAGVTVMGNPAKTVFG